MIILDTNVFSEPLRPVPNEAVVEWLDAQVVETLYLTTLGVATSHGFAVATRDTKPFESVGLRVTKPIHVTAAC